MHVDSQDVTTRIGLLFKKKKSKQGTSLQFFGTGMKTFNVYILQPIIFYWFQIQRCYMPDYFL